MLEGEQEEERRRELEKKQRKEKEKLLLQKREIESKLFGDPGNLIFASRDEERSKLRVLF